MNKEVNLEKNYYFEMGSDTGSRLSNCVRFLETVHGNILDSKEILSKRGNHLSGRPFISWNSDDTISLYSYGYKLVSFLPNGDVVRHTVNCSATDCDRILFFLNIFIPETKGMYLRPCDYWLIPFMA